MLHAPEKYRDQESVLSKSIRTVSNAGIFTIPHHRIHGYRYFVICSNQLGWEHVSLQVSKIDEKTTRCPTWEEMCYIKDLFWDETDCVVQYHPAKNEYVNRHPFVLHLWRPTTQVIPIPPKILV